MKLNATTVQSKSIQIYDRLDANFYSNASVGASEQIEHLSKRGVKMTTIGAMGSVSMPARTALARAESLEDSLPYLRPYDVFDYIPTAADHVSVPRNKKIDSFRIKTGSILQTRSGRNLGPCTLADDVLAQFALSDDMIRIHVEEERDRLVLLAFLKTSLGQALIRRGRSGSVIDHLTVSDVEAVPVPVFPVEVSDAIGSIVGDSVLLRQQGRTALKAALKEVENLYPISECTTWTHWSMQAQVCEDRLDAGYYHPMVRNGKQQLLKAGGVSLGTLATAALPVRYKRYYVEEVYGRPIVSGRQLLQPEPINLRYVSDRSFKNTDDYEIRSGYTVFGAVGRSEGRQAWPALVTADRERWLASNDVMRLVPNSDVRPGALWLAVATPQVQSQIKALSFGSVVDHMNPWDVESVIVPVFNDSLAARVEQAWDDLAQSTILIQNATSELEKEIQRLGG